MIDPNFDPSTIPLGYTYDHNGDVLSYSDEFGFWCKYTRDDAGRGLTYCDSDGNWYTYTYDHNGKHTITRTQGAA